MDATKEIAFCLVECHAGESRPRIWYGSLGDCQRMMRRRYDKCLESLKDTSTEAELASFITVSDATVFDTAKDDWLFKWCVVAPDPADFYR